jgi:hypothetical protein
MPEINDQTEANGNSKIVMPAAKRKSSHLGCSLPESFRATPRAG